MEKHTHILEDGTIITHSHEDQVHGDHHYENHSHEDQVHGDHNCEDYAHGNHSRENHDYVADAHLDHIHGDHIHTETDHMHVTRGEGCSSAKVTEEGIVHTHVASDGTVYTHVHSHTHTKAVLNRLSRAIGHLEHVKRMVEEGQDCTEVLIQLSAVKSAINNTGKVILQDHIEHCIVDAVEHGDQKAIDDLNKAIDRFVK